MTAEGGRGDSKGRARGQMAGGCSGGEKGEEKRNGKRASEGGGARGGRHPWMVGAICCDLPGLSLPALTSRHGHPLLPQDANLSESRLRSAYEELVRAIRTLYQKCRLVHADLSEYNILWHDGSLWIIGEALPRP